MKDTLIRAFTVVLLAAPALMAQSAKRAFVPEDWYRVARVGGGAISQDGNTLAFTVTTVLEEKNVRNTEVWIQPIAGGGHPGPERVAQVVEAQLSQPDPLERLLEPHPREAAAHRPAGRRVSEYEVVVGLVVGPLEVAFQLAGQPIRRITTARPIRRAARKGPGDAATSRGS